MEDGKLHDSHPGNKQNPKIAVLHAHDSKKFKVELFSGQHEVYQQFFKKEFARIVSKSQIVMGIISVAAQIATMSMLPRWTGYGIHTPIWTSIISMIAAVFVIMCCHKTTYVRLHLAMAFHLLSIFGMIILTIEGFCEVIPSLKRRLFSSDNDNGHNNYYYNNNYNHQYDVNENSTATYYAPRYNNYYDNRSELRSMKVMAVSLFFTCSITFMGLAQMFLSFVMSMMTGRAMCAGRSKLEGKIFAMEILGREDKDLSAVICSNQVSHNDIPPPYTNVSLGHIEGTSFA